MPSKESKRNNIIIIMIGRKLSKPILLSHIIQQSSSRPIIYSYSPNSNDKKI